MIQGEHVNAIGQSRGGPNTKIHAAVDAKGRPIALILTPGNTADIRVAAELLLSLPRSRLVIADKGYDANAFRDLIAEKGAVAVIPNKANRKVQLPFDEVAYRGRNVVERTFCRLKDWRRINTRYDRLGRNFASTIAIAAIITWWT